MKTTHKDCRDLSMHAARRESAPLRALVSDLDASLERRQCAIRLLYLMRAKEAIPELTHALATDDEMAIRWQCAYSLMQFKDPVARDALLAALDDDDDIVACQATWSLTEIPTTSEVVERLSDAVLTGQPARARCAAGALGKIRDEAALPALAGALERQERDVADAAAKALRKFRTPDAKQILREARRERLIRRVVEAAIEVLRP